MRFTRKAAKLALGRAGANSPLSVALANSRRHAAVAEEEDEPEAVVTDTRTPGHLWAPRYLHNFFRRKMDPGHLRLWDHLSGIEYGKRSRPYVAIWPRGVGKSTTAEAAVVYLGATERRRFILYVSRTQDQADKHVQAIAAMLGEYSIRTGYPLLAQRELSQFGHQTGWSSSLLRTASGFKVMAVGLDKAVRGIKLGADRPDGIILDDIDGRHDSENKVKKIIETLTDTVIPAGVAGKTFILAVQNKISRNGVFAQLARKQPPFLMDRVLDEVPAWEGGKVVYELDEELGVKLPRLRGATFLWSGLDLDAIEAEMVTEGPKAVQRELNHKVDDVEGALWRQADLDEHRIDRPPGVLPCEVVALTDVVIGVDPPASADGAECGIVARGLDGDDHLYTLADDSVAPKPGQPLLPERWGAAAVRSYIRHRADYIIAEANNGGEMVRSTVLAAAELMGETVQVRIVHATRGKRTRAEPSSLYAPMGQDHMIGLQPELEEQLTGWTPGNDSPDRLDAFVWASHPLLAKIQKRKRKRRKGRPRTTQRA